MKPNKYQTRLIKTYPLVGLERFVDTDDVTEISNLVYSENGIGDHLFDLLWKEADCFDSDDEALERIDVILASIVALRSAIAG